MNAVTKRDAVRQLKAGPDYQKLLEKYADRDWRMNTLYYVLDEEGDRVLYKRRPGQEAYAQEAHLLDIIVKARQLGFSTEIAIEITDLCIFRKNQAAGIIDLKLEDAKKKLQKIKFAYEGLPAEIRAIVRLTKDNEDELKWSNGSSVVVGVSHRGGTLQYLHVSEFGKKSTDDPDGAKEVITGAFATVAPGGKIKVESTAHGTEGEFYKLVQAAEKHALEKRPFGRRDFKLHFFPWYIDPKYRENPQHIIIPLELQDYFKELELVDGVKLDGAQRAWYAIEYARLGKDDMRSEFPSTMKECFFNSLEGTFFKEVMTRAREQGRVGGMVPHDPARRVNTFWDKGINPLSDQNAIIFHQTDGVRHRLIHYYENAGESLGHYIKKVDEIGRERGFLYGEHYGPHDLDHKQYGDQEARSLHDIAAKDYRFKFTIVPKVISKEDSIEAARTMLNMTWIDEEHCARLIKCLDSYRKQWSKPLGQWTNKPLHNWASNASDALQTGAVGLKPDGSIRQAKRAHDGERRGTTQWSS